MQLRGRSGRWGFLMCGLCAFILCRWSTLHAQDRQRVLVLLPPAPTPLENELMTRLQGELRAEGFEVIARGLSAGSDPARALQQQGSELEVAGFVGQQIATPDAGVAAEALRLWLFDPADGALLVQESPVQDEQSVASALAVQGFELLQARDAARRLPPPRPAAPAAPAAPPPPAREPQNAELAALVGGGVLYDVASGGAALTPVVMIAYAPAWSGDIIEGIDGAVRLGAAGFGAPTLLQETDRRVEVVQSFALLQAVVSLDTGSWLRPFGTLGAGAYFVSIEGVGSGPVVGRSETTTSPVAGAGLGLAARALSWVLVQIEAQALFALPPTTVELNTATAATFGEPLIAFSLGAGVAL